MTAAIYRYSRKFILPAVTLMMIFGAILAATDPVAVGAIFTRFPIPLRLNVLIEGESLFNEGTCVISVNSSFSARNIPVQRNIRYDYRYIDRD